MSGKANVKPPNGEKVTMTMVYAALYQMDSDYRRRFNGITDSINGMQDRLTTHEDEHNIWARDEVVTSAVKLDVKKTGVVGLVGTAVGAAVGAGLAVASLLH